MSQSVEEALRQANERFDDSLACSAGTMPERESERMCQSPALLPSGVLIPCRKCWQCRENKINDWVGRCIAESETAKASNSITLTYGGGDHAAAAVLTYSDVQKYFKLLRKHGYPLRYFAVGEYGSTKGRSHWHVVVFWQGEVPEHQTESRFLERHWPHGFSYWEKPNPAAIRYVCKYLQKDLREAERQGHVSMSKKPPLGHAYFVQLAGRYVEAGLAPQNPFYTFPHVRDDNGAPVAFHMHSVTLDYFCQSFIDQWAARYGTHPPQSEVIESYCDRKAKYSPDPNAAPFSPRQSYPWIAAPPGAAIQFSETRNAYYYDHDGQRLYWSWNLEGKRAWQKEIRTEESAQRQASIIGIEAGRYRALSGGT